MDIKKNGKGQETVTGFAIVENCGYIDYKHPNNLVLEPLRMDDIYNFHVPVWSHDTESARDQGMKLAFYSNGETAKRVCAKLQEYDRSYKFEVVKMKISLEIER